MKGERRIFSAAMWARGTAETVFPLFCPVREYDWVPPWRCEMVYSDSGFAEQDCVFKTDFPGEGPDTWVVSRYEPPELLEFIRVNRRRVMRYTISLVSEQDGTSHWEWRQTITGLTEEGNRAVRHLKAEDFAEKVSTLEMMLNHYLGTGRPAESENA